MQPLPISCYIRTRNEAKRIGAVVRAASQLVNDVVVVDCGSSDETRDIAVQEGARVVEHEWLGNGHQKRIGEEASKNDWLLDLDADELLSDELQDEIRELFAASEPSPGIYSLKLVTVPPFPKGMVWKTCNLMRRNKLYHRTIVRMPAHAAWDQLDVPQGVKVRELDGSLLHYSFADIEQQVSKMNRVSSVRAQETKLKSKRLLALRIVFAFPVYFFKKLILHRMYRGGVYGFACAAVIASNRWLKDVKMYEMHLAKDGRNEL